MVCRLLLLIVLSLPVSAKAQLPGFPTEVHFPSIAVGDVAAGPQISGWVYRPEGSGPFPALILAHSCAGYGTALASHENYLGWRMAQWGYLVLAPDSFRPRGKREVCRDLDIISPDTRVADIAGALDYLASRPDVVRGRIGLIGHSHGGTTAIRSALSAYRLAERGLRAAVAYYPGCSAERDRSIDRPLLILMGEKDNWMRPEWCRALQAAGFVRPELVEVVYYPDAGHSFDFVVEDPATIDAERRTRVFFDRLLK
jgi:dienelactone hydrolase